MLALSRLSTAVKSDCKRIFVSAALMYMYFEIRSGLVMTPHIHAFWCSYLSGERLERSALRVNCLLGGFDTWMDFQNFFINCYLTVVQKHYL